MQEADEPRATVIGSSARHRWPVLPGPLLTTTFTALLRHWLTMTWASSVALVQLVVSSLAAPMSAAHITAFASEMRLTRANQALRRIVTGTQEAASHTAYAREEGMMTVRDFFVVSYFSQFSHNKYKALMLNCRYSRSFTGVCFSGGTVR